MIRIQWQSKDRKQVHSRNTHRLLMLDGEFVNMMNNTEKNAWNAVEMTVHNFLGNYKYPSYKQIVENMLEGFRILGCMPTSVIFLKI